MHFQQLDEERIIYTRSALWLTSNLCSATYVMTDQSCEAVRATLEQCDVGKDIQEFIRSRRTGSLRPAPIPYTSFYDADPHGTPLHLPVASPHTPNLTPAGCTGTSRGAAPAVGHVPPLVAQ